MKLIFCILFNILLLNTLQAQKYTEQYIREANSLGNTWWLQVNNDNYKEAYKSLSTELKEKMTMQKWTSQMSELMQEFGKIQNRKVINTEFKSEIEGLDDGFYVIIEYEVNYTKTRNHIEYLLLRQNDKLKWKIIDFQYQFQQIE